MVPTLHAGSCQLWWAWTSAASPHLLDLLDEQERHRHARFRRPQDRALFLVSHALARIVAGRHVATAPGAIRYCRDVARHGKPRFTGSAAALELSISHSGERIVVALSRAVALGVDVERVSATSAERSLVESVLCMPEQRALMALPQPAHPWAFCRYWTRKEAVLKATGDGLAVSPKRIVVTSPTSDPALVHWSGPRRPAEPVHLYDLDAAPGYAASLASIGTALEHTSHDGCELLQARA
ncbi:MAG: 4-phosphopantetheinyl transferase [Solirubrobacteraceae bacterium]|jgi:4'-phosphopantetheinyl transferase|nr:4-phosphopantetheinyl transferase [Solirubrobacteraceae bacterium]